MAARGKAVQSAENKAVKPEDDVESRAVDVPAKATELGPGDPEVVAPLSQMGSTFAERAAAARKSK